jgi:hypothetical protein
MLAEQSGSKSILVQSPVNSGADLSTELVKVNRSWYVLLRAEKPPRGLKKAEEALYEVQNQGKNADKKT